MGQPIPVSPDAGRRIAALISQISAAPRVTQPSRFATSRGSVYVQLPNGTTVRYKAQRPEHGLDSGWMERSDGTVFLAPRDADRLSVVQATSPRGLRLLQDQAAGRLAVGYADELRPFRGTIVPYEMAAREGAMPLEMWNDHSQHFGNVITELEPEPNWQGWLERYVLKAPPPRW